MNEQACDGPAITARALEVAHGKTRALDRLDLEVARGAVTVIVGRNGAGKSTLLRTAMGLERVRGGTLFVLGRDPARDRTRLLERVGYVPDSPDVPGWMTPVELLRLLEPHYDRFAREAAIEGLRALGVPLDRRFRSLSRGQAMTAMIVAATAHDPELLLLDEPFAALDPLARRDVLRAVIASLKSTGRAIVLTTHDLEVARRLADRVVMIDAGRVVWCREVQGDEDAAGEPLGDEIERVLETCAAGGRS